MRSLENTSIDKFAQKLARTKVGRVILPALMITGGAASACSSPTQEVKPVVSISTPTSEPARATVTPFPIGAEIATSGDPKIDDITRRLVNKEPVSEEEILSFNASRIKENNPGEATATAIAATKPTTTPTAEPTKTLPAPEATNGESCEVIPTKYCNQAELVERQTALGTTTKMIGISLPADQSLRLPIDGQVAKTQLDSNVAFYKGSRAVIIDPKNPKRRYIFTGDLKFDNMLSLNMKKGGIFGYTQDTGIEMLGYNVVFYVADIGPDNKEIVNEEEMKKIFPEAYAKPLKQATSTPQQSTKGGGTINITTFYSNSPK